MIPSFNDRLTNSLRNEPTKVATERLKLTDPAWTTTAAKTKVLRLIKSAIKKPRDDQKDVHRKTTH